MSTGQPIKREPISVAIKRSIRLHQEENKELTIGEMTSWAEEKYGIPFLPATMRTIIFPKPTKSTALTSQSIISSDRQRERGPKWPELELELATWYGSLMTAPTGHEIRNKAIEIWTKLAPERYISQEQPSFGDNWRDKFKARHGFKPNKGSAERVVLENEASLTAHERFLDVGHMTAASVGALRNSRIQTPINKLADLDYFSLDEPQDYTSQQLVICPPKTQIKRPRIQDASSSAPRTLILPSELQRKKEIRDCIFNLFGAISNGEEQIPFGFVECLVDTFVVSPIGTTKSSKPRATSQDLLCKYHKAESKRVESNSAASMKAVRILQLADAFALKKPALADEYELEWDLWFDPVIRLPSQDFQSKNHAGSESGGGINDAQVDPSSCTTSAPANRTSAPHVKHRQVTVLSKMAGHGRTDILTSTQFTVGQPEINEYAAEVILTLPSKELGSAQIRFLLWQQANLGSKTLRTPMISASQLRPNDSKIFEIAAVGTKEALIQMFMTREASIGDRDMCGRFLINYAILGCNLEVCRYLLEYVNDIDAYEIGFFGNYGPLLSLVRYDAVYMTEDIREAWNQCYKMLLGKGADPTLYAQNTNIFETQLLSGLRDAVETSLNSGFPGLNMDSLGDEDHQYFSPLCCLAAYYARGRPDMFQAAEKFKFLLNRGANVRFVTSHGHTCLHLLLQLNMTSKLHLVGSGLYSEDEFVSILMAMIAAGADVRAVNICGSSVSNYAWHYGNQQVWIQALAACGYNPWDIFTLEDEWNHLFSGLGLNVFFAGTITTRPTKLSLEQHYSQQTSISPADECLRVKQSIDRTRFFSQKENLTVNDSQRCTCTPWDDGKYCDEYSDSDSSDDEEWENASNFQEDHYMPTEDNPNWMSYVPHHRFFWR